jgi:glycerol-3-phosphate O-acyltransferase
MNSANCLYAISVSARTIPDQSQFLYRFGTGRVPVPEDFSLMRHSKLCCGLSTSQLRHSAFHSLAILSKAPKPVSFATMTQTVPVPLWLLILILLFATVTFASHFLFPSVRWFFRKRMERVVARLNTRLARPIQPFKLARRHDMIQRIIYDPDVTAAIVEHAQRENVPEGVAFELARRYAREIVPSFSATLYFSVGTRVAKWLSRSLYDVRLGTFDRDVLERIDREAALVFVINHRSNMDYVLVTYLVAPASALSYAVGEWARVWPLSAMIRSMGAYFIRRKDRSRLYRRVLARYVQMATDGGVTQAFFPEGGLSLDGRIAPARMGILSYIIEGHKPGDRNVVFVPVALNYDRVLEDRFLIAADKNGVRRFRPPVWSVMSGVGGHLWKRVTGRFRNFGSASVSFGTPLSLDALIADIGTVSVEAVAEDLMQRVSMVVPVLPVPLVCRGLLQGNLSAQSLSGAVQAQLDTLLSLGMPVPQAAPEQIVAEGLALLRARRVVVNDGDAIAVVQGEGDLVRYYANSISHHFASQPERADPGRAEPSRDRSAASSSP